MATEKLQGVIKTLRGTFGFIRCDADHQEYFFHAGQMEQTSCRFEELQVGNRVAFTPIEGNKGPRAIEVQRL